MSSHSGTEFGRITFEFETLCTADCELYFMMVRIAPDKCLLLYQYIDEVNKEICFLGRKQEEYVGSGVMGENESKTVLHTRHDKECLSFLHMGFPED